MVGYSRVKQRRVEPWQSVESSIQASRAIVECMQQSQVEASKSMAECSRVKQRQVEPWQGAVDYSRGRQRHDRVWQSQVEPSRAMVECTRVMWSQVGPQQCVVESRRGMQIHGSCRVQQSQVEEVVRAIRLQLTLVQSCLLWILLHSIPWLYLTTGTTPYHGSTLLYLTLVQSCLLWILLHSIPWLYLTTGTTPYHGSTLLYLTLLHSTMTLLASI